jgi:hypothetical protein
MPHTYLLIMKGHLNKSLSQINTASVRTVLSIHIPAQIKQCFMSEKCKFLVKNTIMYCLQKAVTKVSVFFSHNCLLQLLEPVLFYTAIKYKFLFALYTVFKTCACLANCARDLQHNVLIDTFLDKIISCCWSWNTNTKILVVKPSFM